MIQLLKDDTCEVCGRCTFACSEKAITFVFGDHGNLQPRIDRDACIECGMCATACKEELFLMQNFFESQYFIGRSKDADVIANSSSGGIFTEIARYVFSSGRGVVFGAFYDAETHMIRHGKADSLEEIQKFRKSKYAQSDWTDVDMDVRAAINQNKFILFTGLPCQVTTVKERYGWYKDIIFVDLFCHGVVGADWFRQYIEMISPEIDEVDFRGEDADKLNNFTLVLYENKKELLRESLGENMLYSMFIQSSGLKHACFHCRYSDKKHVSDITLGDFDDKRILENTEFSLPHLSIVAVNTKHGNKVFSEILEYINVKKLEDKKAINAFYPNHAEQIGSWGYNESIYQQFQCNVKEWGFQMAIWIAGCPYEAELMKKVESKKKESDSLIIYGAGNIGKNFYRLIQLIHPEWKIKCFAVTAEKKNESIAEIPIISIYKLKEIVDDCLIVIAVSEQYRLEIEKTLLDNHLEYFV